MNQPKPPGLRLRFHWLSTLATVAVLLVGGYLFFTRAGRSGPPAATFTPFQPAPTPFQPAPSGNAFAPKPPAPGQPWSGGAGVPPFPFATRPGSSPGRPGGPIVHQMAVVDLNAASLAELETLPDITPDYARKIISGRPYRSMSDLERAGIPRHIVEQISPPAIIRVTERGSPPDFASKPNKKP